MLRRIEETFLDSEQFIHNRRNHAQVETFGYSGIRAG